MNRTIHQTIRKAALAAVAALALAAAPAHAKGLKQKLDAIGSLPDARGEVKLMLQKATAGRFEIKVKKLAPSSSYELFVGTVKVATLETSPKGDGKLRFRTSPKSSHDQILGFDPRGARIALRAADGVDVLAGNVALAPADQLPEGKVICCEPDDDHAECEDRTADECVARGGTVTSATSCLPNPCAEVSAPERETICCVPDDGGPECEDRSPAECAARGGVTVEATSCNPNPCGGDATPADDGSDDAPGDDNGGTTVGSDDAPGDDNGGTTVGSDDASGDDNGGTTVGSDGAPGDDNGGTTVGSDDAPGDDNGGTTGGADDTAGDDGGSSGGGNDDGTSGGGSGGHSGGSESEGHAG